MMLVLSSRLLFFDAIGLAPDEINLELTQVKDSNGTLITLRKFHRNVAACSVDVISYVVDLIKRAKNSRQLALRERPGFVV